MGSLYENIMALCKERGIKGGKMCTDLGISKSFMTELRKGRTKSAKIETAQKIASYLGVSIEYLLGTENENTPAENSKRVVSDDDIKFALFGGDGEITDAMYEEVRKFAAFVKQREADKK